MLFCRTQMEWQVALLGTTQSSSYKASSHRDHPVAPEKTCCFPDASTLLLYRAMEPVVLDSDQLHQFWVNV